MENDEEHDKILDIFADNFSDIPSESEDIDNCNNDFESEKNKEDKKKC